MDIDILVSFITASVVLTLMPGPDIVFVLMQSISFGKKEGILTALGLVLGIIVHTSLVAFGVSILIKQSEFLFLGIKMFGALYLCYLSYQVFKADPDIVLNTATNKRRTNVKLVQKGFIMNVLNPKVTLFFLAFFPGFLFSDVLSTITQFYVLGGLFMIQAMVIFTLISIHSGRFSKYIRENKSVQLRVKWIQICVFILMAIFLILN